MQLRPGSRRASRTFLFFAALALGAAGASVAACTAAADLDIPDPAAQDARAPGPTDPDDPDDPDVGDDAGDDGGPVEDGGPDRAPPRDAGDILGTLSGQCGTVAAELAKATPSFFENTLVFVAGETYTKASLSPDGQKIFDTPNAGGSSTESEVLSFEVLRYCDEAALVKTETQVRYVDDAGPITDLLVSIGGKKVGVSVTRAYRPPGQPYGEAEARTILEDKLADVNRSSQRVAAGDKWVKQVLHVFASTEAQATAVRTAYAKLDAGLKADTVLLLTRTTGGGFVYCNPDPPLGSECPVR